MVIAAGSLQLSGQRGRDRAGLPAGLPCGTGTCSLCWGWPVRGGRLGRGVDGEVSGAEGDPLTWRETGVHRFLHKQTAHTLWSELLGFPSVLACHVARVTVAF